jgi:YggT family protein
LAYILLAAIFLRVIFSWTQFDPRNSIYQVVYEITEPILGPIRRIMPRLGMIDLAPMVAIFVLFFIANWAAGGF